MRKRAGASGRGWSTLPLARTTRLALLLHGVRCEERGGRLECGLARPEQPHLGSSSSSNYTTTSLSYGAHTLHTVFNVCAKCDNVRVTGQGG